MVRCGVDQRNAPKTVGDNQRSTSLRKPCRGDRAQQFVGIALDRIGLAPAGPAHARPGNRRAAPVPREVGDDEAPPVGMTAVAVQEQQPGQTALPPGQQFYPGADAVETAALRHIGQGRLQPGRTRRRRPAVPRQRVVCPRLSHQNFLVRVNATRRPSALACPGSQPPALLTKGGSLSNRLVTERPIASPLSMPRSLNS